LLGGVRYEDPVIDHPDPVVLFNIADAAGSVARVRAALSAA
jgi:hypothetical protein